jgi:hypothetical protein
MSDVLDVLLDFHRQKKSVSHFNEETVTAEVASCRKIFFEAGRTADCLSKLANYAAVTRRRLRNLEKPCPKRRTKAIVELQVGRWMMENPPESLASPQEILDWLKRHRAYVQHGRNWAAGNTRYKQGQRTGVTRRSIALHLLGVGDTALRKLDVLIAETQQTIDLSVEKADDRTVTQEPPQKFDKRGNGLLF